MKDLLSFVNECVNTFHSYFNYGKSEKMMTLCRPAVEKFIFNKLYDILYEIYSLKYDAKNKKFIDKLERIKKLNVDQIMEFLEVRPKFRGNTIIKKTIPYKSTIDCINKLELEINPKDKFDCLIKSSLEMRNYVLEISAGKGILNALDDELPLFIYCVTQSNIKNLFAELFMVEDYLNYSNSMDNEPKVMITMQVIIILFTLREL